MNISTHRFRVGEISSNLCKTVSYLLNIPADELHHQAVDYYFNRKTNDNYGWGFTAQLNTLAILYDVMICVIGSKRAGKNRTNVKVTFYGEIPSLGKPCIFMWYNQITLNYYPLTVASNENLNDEMNYDENVKELLRRFIREEIGDDDEIDFDNTDLNIASASLDHEQPNGHESIHGSILMDSPTGHEVTAIDGLLPPLDDKRKLSVESADEMPSKRLKVIEDATDQKPVSRIEKSETNAIEGLIQDERIHDETDADDDEQPYLPMVLEDEHNDEKVPGDQRSEDICSTNISDLF